MRAVVQRVTSASVEVAGEVVGAIEEPGLLVYLGVTHGDGEAEIGWIARKLWGLRILAGEQSASDFGAPLLVVSQFTLYGDARKDAGRRGRRPRPGPSASRRTTPCATYWSPWARGWSAACSAPT